jgi:hypothetical protein
MIQDGGISATGFLQSIRQDRQAIVAMLFVNELSYLPHGAIPPGQPGLIHRGRRSKRIAENVAEDSTLIRPACRSASRAIDSSHRGNRCLPGSFGVRPMHGRKERSQSHGDGARMETSVAQIHVLLVGCRLGGTMRSTQFLTTHQPIGIALDETNQIAVRFR